MIDLERTLNLLLKADVEFVVIGGFAQHAQGSSQLTRDLDVCYDRSRKNIQRLVKALEPCHPRLRGAPGDLPLLFAAETIRRGLNFTLTTDPGDTDLPGEVQGIGQFKQALERSTAVELFGRNFRVLSLDGRIAAKRAAGRRRDLAVIPELEALLELESLRLGAKVKPSKKKERLKRKGGKQGGRRAWLRIAGIEVRLE